MKRFLLVVAMIFTGGVSLPVQAGESVSWSATISVGGYYPPPPVYYPPPVVYYPPSVVYVVPQPVYPAPPAGSYGYPVYPSYQGYAGRPYPPSRFDSPYRSPPNFLWRPGQFQPHR